MSKLKLATTAVLVVVAATSAVGGWVWARQSSGAQEHPTAPQLIDLLRDQWNDEQEAVLADGVITLEEYNATTERVARCLEADGLTVYRLRGAGVGGADELSLEAPAATGSPRDVVLGCYERHQGKLSMVWAEQNRPTTEELTAHAAAIDSCLARRGVTPRPLEELAADEAALSVYVRCIAEVPRPGTR
jgi:hypothetical protein